MSLECDNVKNVAEGETIAPAETKEHVVSNQGKQEATDDSKENDTTEAASLVQNLEFAKLGKEKLKRGVSLKKTTDP